MSITLSKTHYAESLYLSAIFNGGTISGITPYIGLFTTAPDKTGGGTEVSTSGTAYARVAPSPVLSGGVLVYSPQDATGSTISFSDVIWSVATGGGFGTVVAVGVFDAASSGHLLYYQTMPGVTVSAGLTAKLSAGNLSANEA